MCGTADTPLWQCSTPSSLHLFGSFMLLKVVENVWEIGFLRIFAWVSLFFLCPLSLLTPAATLFYKPERNKTNLSPKYYIHESKEWIVFPHELDGLSESEVVQNVGEEAAKS